jgi:hypothetical protein
MTSTLIELKNKHNQMMKNIFVLIALLFSSAYLNAQNPDPWTEYMTPSSVHNLLSQYTGKFKMEITMSMGDRNEASIISINSDHSMLLGGRFLELNQQGKMMTMDYQSIMTMGFNNTDKKFALTSITNMGTGTLSLFGDWDEKSRSATLFGQLSNPMTGNIIHVKQVVRFIDNNTILIESYDRENEKPEKKTVQYKLIRSF